MKFINKIIIYISVVTIVTIYLFSGTQKKVYAEVPSTQKAEFHNGTWSPLNWTYIFHQKYWTIQDATGIPTSTLTNPNYFYTDDNETFFEVSGTELIQIILNRGIGIVLQPRKATDFIGYFFGQIKTPLDTVAQLYVEGGLYDGNNQFLGYCLNDITGCYYEGITIPANQPAIDIPSQTTNNVYNCYQYYSEQNSTIPDYVTIYPISQSYFVDHMEGTENDDLIWQSE